MTTVASEPAAWPLARRLNVAPMGPIVTGSFKRFVFRPFRSSTTYRNLRDHRAGVFHVTDDALMLARAAIGCQDPVALRPAQEIEGLILIDACRYYELRVTNLDDRAERTWIQMEPVATGRLRDFVGFNRARHAVVEAAILATRVFLTGPDPVLAEFERLQVIVDKTGSEPEHQAMAQLRRYVLAGPRTKDGEP